MSLLKPSSAVVILFLVAALTHRSAGQDAVSVFDDLAQRAAQLAASLPPIPDTRDGWEQQRAELLPRLAATLGLPEREPMRAAQRDRRQVGDLVYEEIAYLWAEQAGVSATVIRSAASSSPQPAVIVCPGWLGHYTFRPYREFVEQMAQRGFAVLFIDDPRTGPRHAPTAGLYASASAAGIQVAGIQVFDALRALDYLLTRADIDPGRIGIAGLGQGAMQAWLAAALEPRLAFVVAVSGTSTVEALVQSAAAGNEPEAPSAFVTDLLKVTDMDRVAACVAPRPVVIAGSAKHGRWPLPGQHRVVSAMKAVYGLYDALDRFALIPGDEPDDMTPYAAEILNCLEELVPAATSAAPAAAVPPCAPLENPDFSMLAYVQRRIAQRAASLPELLSQQDWKSQRTQVIDWLRQRCAVDTLQPPADEVAEVTEAGGMTVERLMLGVDAGFRCPATLYRPTAPAATAGPGVVLSHDDRACAADARLAEAARQLVAAGYCVLVPDHASVAPQSRQTLAGTGGGFYGDEAARLYGPADAVGLPPLALRVREDLAAFRHLAARPEVAVDGIVLAGIGLGGIDACLATLLEPRVAGLAVLDATTLRDWAQNVAPGESRFFHVMPVLPGLIERTDLDRLVAAVAPRPLLLVRLKDGWPRSGFDQVAEMASKAYALEQAADALLVLGPREVTVEREAARPEGVARRLIAVARTLVPAPPQPGIVGNLEGLRGRSSVDSAAGLIWIVAEMDGYEQAFVDEGYRLETWSFFNDNGAAQQGRLITPLIFHRQGDAYRLTGTGKTRTNAGSGVQTFDFEPVFGTADVGEDHYFGWHTGDAEAANNPGVVEYQDSPDARMIILTGDGQMANQPLKLGETYRRQAEFRRRYSVMAVSKKP